MLEYHFFKGVLAIVLFGIYNTYGYKQNIIEKTMDMPLTDAIEYKKNIMFNEWVSMNKYIFLLILGFVLIFFSKTININLPNIGKVIFMISLLIFLRKYYIYYQMKNELDYEGIEHKDILQEFKLRK